MLLQQESELNRLHQRLRQESKKKDKSANVSANGLASHYRSLAEHPESLGKVIDNSSLVVEANSAEFDTRIRLPRQQRSLRLPVAERPELKLSP